MLVGKKGYSILISLISTFPTELITDVVSARDIGVDNDYFEEMHVICALKGIGFHNRTDKTFSETDYRGFLIAIGWRWLLPSGKKVIVVHDSLLPRYRGFAPLVNCLINGDEKIGATALFADKDYDKGDIIVQLERSINYPITISTAIDMMCELYIEVVKEVVKLIVLGDPLEGHKQIDSNATYSIWRDEDDYWVNWFLDSRIIGRFVDAVGSPYKGARTMYGDKRVAIIKKTELISDQNIINRRSAIGKVIYVEGNFPVVVCGSGLIKIKEMIDIHGNSILPLKKFRTRFKTYIYENDTI